MRVLYAVLLLTALVVGCAAGCTVGPAANRAGEGDTEPGPEASGVPEVPGEPETAPAEGDVAITAMLPTGLRDPCCLAELPSGDLLLGTRESGTIHRLDTTTGDLTDLGTLSGVAYAPDRTLLALTVESEDPDAKGLFAYYTEGESAAIARYGYDATEGELDELDFTYSTLVSGLPQPETGRAALAFGPDGMLYAGTATGDILRMTSIGWTPDDNPDPGSFTYATALGGSVTGLAWDGTGRLWVATPGQVNAVGAPPLRTWPPGERVTGLAYIPASGSLWLSTATGNGGLWRIPLNGVRQPELFPLHEPPVALLPARQGGGLWLLTADGTVARAAVR
ncbi:PQQ-dependent sugar dehydrogenase [Streptomyces sp. 6N223]|uniref:PQQ-dependent sugar dehydrogenase n=1 Tax=Streptomyces sp. 6N223 TaxID=3457412 RepID=UPI003FD3A594